MSVISFTKVSLPNGWLGNMSRYPVMYDGHVYHTAEHLFQALRFPPGQYRARIRDIKSPMAAKMYAKTVSAYMCITPRSDEDVQNMRVVLRHKLRQTLRDEVTG